MVLRIALLFPILLGAIGSPGEGSCLQGESAPLPTLETFKQTLASLKGVKEKALAVQAVGWLQIKDAAWVPLLSPHLAPTSQDIDLALPLAAMESLSRFKGQPAAAQALGRALPGYQKVPWLWKKLLAALARVGHEMVVPVFEGYLRGTDSEAAVVAVETLAEMPPGMALEVVFREWSRAQQNKEKAGPDVKRVNDRLAPEYYKLTKSLSGENYPSMVEMAHWWQLKGAAFKEKAQEQERSQISQDPAPPPTALPPVLLVELLFEESPGGEFANSGVSSVRSPRAAPAKPAPARSLSTPWGKGRGTRSLDFGKKPALSALDLETPPDYLKGLMSFTVCGWINPRLDAEGSGGSRIVSWLGPDQSGVELVFRAGGSLQIGINELAAGSPSKSPGGLLPPVDEKLPDAVDRNWRFCAVTYDSTAQSAQIQFYLGTTTKDATCIATCDYGRGPLGSKSSPVVSIGNVPPAQRTTVADAMFRGLLDDVRIFGSRHDGSGALAPIDIVRLQDRPPTPKKP